MTMNVNKAGFEQRLARISSGRQFVPDGVVVARPRAVPAKKAPHLGNALYPLSIVMAFFLGLFTLFASRYARFHLLGGAGAGADVLADYLAMDMAMSMVVSFVIRMATNMKSPEHLAAKGLGIGVAALCMHMAVHRAPGLFGLIFSDAWVRGVIASTQPNSILFLTIGG